MKDSTFKFIDLFCGIGGFHQACKDFGGECVFASDIDEDCQRVYEKNYGIRPFGDITKIDAKDIPSHDLLCAGFPCQSFSKAGKRMGFKDETYGTLFFDIIRIVRHHKPKYILLENVRNLLGHDNGNTWRVIRESIQNVGYNVATEPIIFSPHYLGIPQHRERVFIMAVRKDIGVTPDFIFDVYNLTPCTIESVLSDDSEIPNLKDYQLTQEHIDLIDLWQEFLNGINCPPPTFPIWGDFLKPLEDRKTAKWRQAILNKNANLYETNKEFIDDWLQRARKQRLFFGSKANFEWQVGKEKPDIWENIIQFRPSGIRVKKPNYFPALVAIAQTPIIGKRKRFLTPRECARLQSFPEDFIIDDSDGRAYRQFGNAVNVDCAKMFVDMLLYCGS